MSLFPQPGLTNDWKQWAKRVIEFFQTQERERSQYLAAPVYYLAELQAPDRDGLIVFVVVTGGDVRPCYSEAGVWKRFDTNVAPS